MATHLETSYEPLQTYGTESDETPQESGVMIHVVPESGRARWNHIEDLDSFFSRVYIYHQKHGFLCMMCQEWLELIQFVFIVFFSTFLLQCVDYSILFRDKNPQNVTKVTMGDAIISPHQCVAQISMPIWICLLVAAIFWILRFIRVIYHLVQFWEIRSFYLTALKISDNDLDNMPYHEVQRWVLEVQREQQMCIHKPDLSELDIYHRILRFKNYMVAMVNKSLLPVKFSVPFIGEIIFLTHGLKYNLELIFFYGPYAPFENSWHLKEDYKKASKRKELATQLSKYILWVGIANLVLCPLILLWQILYSFFNYAEVIKREPGSLGSRSWSLYGRLYLRHFNELDHELNARLSRAYRPASKYMSIFTSPLAAIFAKNLAFIWGSPLAVLLILTVYDEDVITVEHVLTTITVLGALVAVCRVFIPDENLVWCPEKLLTAVLAHIHYAPDTWHGQAHTARVRNEFSQLFQYRAVHLIEELLSPLVTPLILIFCLRYKTLDMVDFFRNFTVDVVGVGDVCSFAQMDVRKHGNPAWQTSVHAEGQTNTQANMYTQAEDGKTELSLIHFTLTNPKWQPPAEAEGFVNALREQAQKDAGLLRPDARLGSPGDNPLMTSLHSVSSLGVGFNSLVASIFRGGPVSSHWFGHPTSPVGVYSDPERSSSPRRVICGALSHAEGPLEGSDRGLLYSLQQGGTVGGTGSLGASMFGAELSGVSAAPFPPEDIPLEFTAADMSLSALYLHELHHRQIRRRGYLESASRSLWQHPHQDMPGISEQPNEDDPHAERVPLLETTRGTLSKSS